MKLLSAFLFVCFHLTITAQSDTRQKKQIELVPSLSINNDFNFQDWYLGFSGGVEDIQYEWGARIGFNFRPFYKKVQIKDGNIVRQYREQKYFLSLDLDKRFLHFDFSKTKLQLFAGIKTGYLMGNYKGTQNDSEKYWVIAPMGGVCFNFDDVVFLKAGYTLFNDRLINVSDSKITLTAIFTL